MASKQPSRQKTPEVCPVCDEDVPRHALACPECGADHHSGWREDADAQDGAGFHDGFDYDDFVRGEFGSTAKPAGMKTGWWIAAIVVIIALGVLLVQRGGL